MSLFCNVKVEVLSIQDILEYKKIASLIHKIYNMIGLRCYHHKRGCLFNMTHPQLLLYMYMCL